jgi:hypothetical protein
MAINRLPGDYSEPFWLEGPVGNNALSYDRRGPSPRLWVPSLVEGTLADIAPGAHVVFEDVDEHGRLQSCTGLRHLVRTTWGGIPTVVVDNHNHAFYFWFEALAAGHVQPGATLVHLDQHRDTRTPTEPFEAAWTLRQTFRYTNAHLNVGNYIAPARQAGLVGEMLMVTGSDGLGNRALAGRPNTILNIDLDFFAPEMSYIDFDRVRRFVDAYLPGAVLITVATSPFFIDQERALGFLRSLAADT